MRPCDLYQEMISCALDGELSPADARALSEHLRTCRECRRLQSAFQDVSAALADSAAQPPADLTARIMRQVRAAAPAAPAAGAQPRRRSEPARRPAQQPASPRPVPAQRTQPQQTAPKKPRRKKGRISPLFPVATVAACLVLILGAVALFGPSGSQQHGEDTTLSGPTGSVTPPAVNSAAPQHTAPAQTTPPTSAVTSGTDSVLLTIPEAGVTSPNARNKTQITDPEAIRQLSALLEFTTETEPVDAGQQPVCVLRDTDADGRERTCAIWLMGDDVIFRSSDSDTYYLAKGSADVFRELLTLLAE